MKTVAEQFDDVQESLSKLKALNDRSWELVDEVIRERNEARAVARQLEEILLRDHKAHVCAEIASKIASWGTGE